MTPAEVSQRAAVNPQAPATLRGMPQVLVRIDAAGEYPVVVDDGETLLSGDGARWRYVCDVGSIAEGSRGLHGVARAAAGAGQEPRRGAESSQAAARRGGGVGAPR